MTMTQRIRKHQNKKTRRRHITLLEGWITVKVSGSYYDMGYQHGSILRKQIEKAKDVLKYLVEKHYKISFIRLRFKMCFSRKGN
jgi:hypothetical protein